MSQGGSGRGGSLQTGRRQTSIFPWVVSDSVEMLKINWQQTNLLLHIGLSFVDEQRPEQHKDFALKVYLTF